MQVDLRRHIKANELEDPTAAVADPTGCPVLTPLGGDADTITLEAAAPYPSNREPRTYSPTCNSIQTAALPHLLRIPPICPGKPGLGGVLGDVRGGQLLTRSDPLRHIACHAM